jgi:hypothetical protein
LSSELRAFLEGGKSGRGWGGGAGFVSPCFSFSSSAIIVSPSQKNYFTLRLFKAL